MTDQDKDRKKVKEFLKSIDPPPRTPVQRALDKQLSVFMQAMEDAKNRRHTLVEIDDGDVPILLVSPPVRWPKDKGAAQVGPNADLARRHDMLEGRVANLENSHGRLDAQVRKQQSDAHQEADGSAKKWTDAAKAKLAAYRKKHGTKAASAEFGITEARIRQLLPGGQEQVPRGSDPFGRTSKSRKGLRKA